MATAMGREMSSVLALPPDEAHLWYTPTAAMAPAAIAAARLLLDDSERARADRFVFPRHRDAFIIAHALVRSALSRYAAVAPADWTFVTGSHGRPRVAGPRWPGELDFNLSHADGIAVLLVGHGVLGVDVEPLSRRAPLEVAGRYFAPAEVSALAALPPDERPHRFFQYWTLKESYIKARGLGLALALDAFAFDLDSEPRPRISFVPPIDDDGARWWFAHLRPTAQHLAAVALRDAPTAVRIVVRPLLPLAD
jgi:4'-phosphopantetheinyl transferase